MKINRTAMPIASAMIPALVLGGCTGSPPQAAPAPRGQSVQAAQPVPLPVMSKAPSPPMLAPPPAAARGGAPGWRDLPQTPGSWTYSIEGFGSIARFGQPGAAPLLALRCDRGRPAVVLQRPGFGAGEVPAMITTSSAASRFSAAPAGDAATARNAAIPFEIALNVRDPLLDAIAFSRGRFMFEMGGAQTLVVPVWSELGRVIEDCR